MREGLGRLIIATAIGGVSAYFITWLVPRSTGFASYSLFAVFWGFLFLLVSALSGIQQEVTRSTVLKAAQHAPSNRIVYIVAVLAGGVFVGVCATSPLWKGAVLGSAGGDLVWPLATGAAFYVVIAVVSGTLYGLRDWRGIFWLVVIEGILRVITVTVALAISDSPVVLAWAVVVPFPLAVATVLVMVYRRVHGLSVLDTTPRGISWNFARTVVASVSMGALISGLPVFVGVTSQGDPAGRVGLVLITMTLTRAPLTVVLMSFQSYLIVLFKSREGRVLRLAVQLCSAVLVAGAGLAVAGAFLGPPVFALLFPGEPVPDGGFIAAMVLSSVVLGMLCVTAPALLALSQHAGYSAGWLVAALVTIGALMLPSPLEQRVAVALLIGPAVGLVVHGAVLVRARRLPAENAA